MFGYNDSFICCFIAVFQICWMTEWVNKITYDKQLHVSSELLARLCRLLVLEAGLIRYFYTAHSHSTGCFTFARCSFSSTCLIKLTWQCLTHGVQTIWLLFFLRQYKCLNCIGRILQKSILNFIDLSLVRWTWVNIFKEVHTCWWCNCSVIQCYIAAHRFLNVDVGWNYSLIKMGPVFEKVSLGQVFLRWSSFSRSSIGGCQCSLDYWTVPTNQHDVTDRPIVGFRLWTYTKRDSDE
jgi:hypothetical protein